MRDAHALYLQLAHGKEAVASGVTEVDHVRMCVPGLAAHVPPLHRHPAADEAVELPVVLDERAGEVDPGDSLDGLFARRFWKVRVQARERRPQVAHQHHVALRCPAKGSLRPEGLSVVGVEALPPETITEMIREGLLDQPVLAVDIGDHGAGAPITPRSLPLIRRGSNRSRPARSFSFILSTFVICSCSGAADSRKSRTMRGSGASNGRL